MSAYDNAVRMYNEVYRLVDDSRRAIFSSDSRPQYQDTINVAQATLASFKNLITAWKNPRYCLKWVGQTLHLATSRSGAPDSPDCFRFHFSQGWTTKSNEFYNTIKHLLGTINLTSAVRIDEARIRAELQRRQQQGTQVVVPPRQVTASGGVLDDIKRLFTMRDRRQEEEESLDAVVGSRQVVVRQKPRTLVEILGGRSATPLVTASSPSDVGREYPPTGPEEPSRPVHTDVGANPWLLPGEEDPYADAISRGVSPDEVGSKAAKDITTPKPGKKAAPWISGQQIADIAKSMVGAIGTAAAAKMQADMIKRQSLGQKIYVPVRMPARQQPKSGNGKRDVPWTAISIGAAGLLAAGVLFVAMRKR